MEIRIKVPMGAKLVVDWEQSGLDDGPSLPNSEQESSSRYDEALSELSEWRQSAMQRGFKSPMDLRGHSFQSGLDNLRELSAWRSAAKKCQFDSPEELASAENLLTGQFIDGALSKKWQTATLCDTPEQAKARLDAYQSIEKTHSDRMDSVLNEWKKATECASAVQAGTMIGNLRKHTANCAENIGSLKQDIRAWQKATGATDPANAINLSFDKNDSDRRFADVYRLQVAAESEVERLKALAGIELAAWQEMTGAKDPNEAYAQKAERDQDLLTAHTEIDRLRKAAQTLGLVSDDSKELAKVRAELQTKCLEAHTWKEQAERVEKSNLARGALLEAVGVALQLNEPIRWDPLPGQVAELKKSEAEWIKKAYEQNERVAPEKARADAEFKRRVDAETYLHQVDNAQFEFTNIRPGYAGLAKEITTTWKQVKLRHSELSDSLAKEQKRAELAEGMFRIEQKKLDDEKQQNIAQTGELQRRGELLVKTCEALGVEKWDDLPGAAEGVMEVLGRKTENAYASEEGLVAAKEDITDILTSQLRDVGIVSAAGAVAGYFGHFVNIDRELDEVRELLGAKIGESIVGATKRVMSTAIFPLPKPEKIEPGQKWAFVMTAKGDRLFSRETFTDGSGCQFDAKSEDLASAFYLGT